MVEITKNFHQSKLSNEFVGGFYEKFKEIYCLIPKPYSHDKLGRM